MAFRIPDQAADYRHYEHLIEVEPALDEHRRQFLHYVLIIKTAHSTKNRSCCDTPDPFVFSEVDIFFLARAAHQIC